jgi:hypothetical protein
MSRADLLIAATALLPAHTWAADCAAPPVKTPDHATCLARQFAERPSPPSWELVFQVKDAKSHWLVYYGPKPDSGPRRRR